MENNKKNNLEEYVQSPLNEIDTFSIDGENKIPQPLVWKNINEMVFPADRWLVNNLFPKEGISIVASISGEGKSLLIMHLAKCISEGTPWFNHPEFKTNKGRVLYVNLEMSESEIQRRGRMIGFDTTNEDLILLNEDDFNLSSDQFDFKYKWLLHLIYEKKIKVVIIDTFRAVAGGLKEEKAEEIRKFFKRFHILRNSGVLVIFLEHVRKPTQLEGKVPKKEQLLGSQDKTANVETLLMIRRDEANGTINIYQRKNRLGIEIAPFAVKIVSTIDQCGFEKMDFQYVGIINDDVNKKEEAKGLILDVLSSGENKTTGQIIELLKKEVGTKNIRMALRELKNQEDVDCGKEGKQNVYSLPKVKPETEDEGVVDIRDELFSLPIN